MPSLYLIESKVREAGSRAPRTRGARRPIAGACVWGGRDAWRVGRDGDASSSWAGNAWVGFSELNGCSMDKPRSIRKHMVATDYATPRHVGLNRRAHGDPASSLAGERMAEFASVRFLPDLRGIKKTRNSAVF
jgi:hypothetical protein